MAIQRSWYTTEEAYQKARARQNSKLSLGEAQFANAPKDTAGNRTGTNAGGRNIKISQLPTGSYTSTKQKPAEAPLETRNAPGGISADVLGTQSYEDIGASLAEKDYQDLSTLSTSYGGTAEYPDSLTDARRTGFSENQADYAMGMDDLEYQTEQFRQQQSDAYGQAKGLASAGATFASGLNGPQGNTALRSSYASAAGKQIERLQGQAEQFYQQVEYKQELLDRALRDGDMTLAQSIQSDINAYTSLAEQSDTQYVNALGNYEQTKAAISQSNIQTFQGLADSGQVLTPDAINGFAKKLGLSFEVANGYYQGVQAVRDDNQLSLEEKALAVEQMNMDLEDQLKGLATEEAKKVDDYLKIVGSGQYSPEQLKQFAISMNIPDESNPVYLADLKLKQAQARVAEATANGELINPLDQQALIAAQYENWATMGYVPGLIPEGGSYGITSDGDGSISVNVEDGFTAGQCGRFVNQVFGKQMMGDSFESKMAWVDPAITIPEAGMAFVMKTESPYGHTGLIESVNAETGMMTVVDSNWSKDEKIQRRQIPISSVSGFVRPPSSVPAGTPILATLDNSTQDNVRAAAAPFKTEQIVKDYNTISAKAQIVNSLVDNGVGGPGDLAIVYEFMKALDPTSVVRETEYATAAASGNIFAGAMARFNGYLKEEGGFLPENVKDAFRDIIDTKLDFATQQYKNLYDEYATAINGYAGGLNVADEVLTDYSKAFESSQDTAPAEDEQMGMWIDLYDNASILDEFNTIW